MCYYRFEEDFIDPLGGFTTYSAVITLCNEIELNISQWQN